MFGVSCDSDPGLPWLVTLLDTFALHEDPQKPTEIVFELDNGGWRITLMEGTHVQGANLGSSFRTNRKEHVLGIAYTVDPEKSFVIDYESICAIASENKTSSRIPWDLWRHKTTRIGHYTRFEPFLKLVGRRAFAMREESAHSRRPWVRSFDFTPGACRFVEQLDPSSEVVPPHVLRRAALTDGSPEWYLINWEVSEDNILIFSVSLRVEYSIILIYQFFFCRRAGVMSR